MKNSNVGNETYLPLYSFDKGKKRQTIKNNGTTIAIGIILVDSIALLISSDGLRVALELKYACVA
jgi:hypothetical protein